MYFDYYPVNSSTPIRKKITNIELAKYIATDWVPGVPISIMNGFSDVLNNILEIQKVMRDDYWHINPNLAATDRQWKGVTSWILGVAFTRFVVEAEGYPWWSPVSAFKGANSTGYAKTGGWSVPPTRSQFQVNRKPAAQSKLDPDYVLCRPNPGGGYDYAFCESKGTAKNITLSSMNKAPLNWSNQVKSVELVFNGKIINVNRHLIVATRINPNAKRSNMRMISVRAWNSIDQTTETDITIFASFLACHYASLCWRLGFQEFAKIMESASTELAQTVTNSSDSANSRRIRGNVRAIDSNIYQRFFAHNDNPQIRVGAVELPIIRTDEPFPSFLLGNQRFEIGLTTEALAIMRAIVNFQPSEFQQIVADAIHNSQAHVEQYRENDQQEIAVTLNGVGVFNPQLIR